MTKNHFAAANQETQPNLTTPCHVSTSPGTFSLRRAKYFTEANRPLLSDEQERVLIKQACMGDIGARRTLVACHMHVVVAFAKRNANRGLPLLDLVWVGIQGIIHALENFDHKGGTSFPSCAAQCIHDYIACLLQNCQEYQDTAHITPPAVFPSHNVGMRNGRRDERAA